MLCYSQLNQVQTDDCKGDRDVVGSRPCRWKDLSRHTLEVSHSLCAVHHDVGIQELNEKHWAVIHYVLNIDSDMSQPEVNIKAS